MELRRKHLRNVRSKYLFNWNVINQYFENNGTKSEREIVKLNRFLKNKVGVYLTEDTIMEQIGPNTLCFSNDSNNNIKLTLKEYKDKNDRIHRRELAVLSRNNEELVICPVKNEDGALRVYLPETYHRRNDPWFRIYELTFDTTDLHRIGDEVKCPECLNYFMKGSAFSNHFKLAHPNHEIKDALKIIEEDVKHALAPRKVPKINKKLLHVISPLVDAEIIVEATETLYDLLSCETPEEILSKVNLFEDDMVEIEEEVERDVEKSYSHYLGKSVSIFKNTTPVEYTPQKSNIRHREIFGLSGRMVKGYIYKCILDVLPNEEHTAVTVNQVHEKINYCRESLYVALKHLFKAGLVNREKCCMIGTPYKYWKQKNVDFNCVLERVYTLIKEEKERKMRDDLNAPKTVR